MTTNPNDDDMLDMELDEEILDEDLDMLDADELDGEWDESVEDAQPAQKPKKKFSLFTVIIIGVAVLAGLGILASMGKSNNAPNTQPGTQTASVQPLPNDSANPDSLQAMQDSNLPQEVTPSQAPVDPVLASQSQGFMNDPSQLEQAGTPSLPETPSMTGFANAPQAPGASETAANTNLPNIDQIKKAELPVPGAAPAPTTAPAPVIATPVAPAAPAPVVTSAPAAAETIPATVTNSIAAKLDQMMSRMDNLEKKIDEKQAVPASGSTSPSRDVEELKTAVTRLEERVSRLAQNPATNTASVPSYNDEPSKVIVKKAVPKPKKKKISSDDNAAWSPSKSASSSSASSNWELRSARSGEAMISRDGGNLQTIRVGDSVPGLGQIQSISEMGGNWVVRGTNGSVSQ